MATTRPFAYNTGGAIPGTIQVGNLAVGTPTNGFESTGEDWWNGPDEDLGYVIAKTSRQNDISVQLTPVFKYGNTTIRDSLDYSGDFLILDTAYRGTKVGYQNGYQYGRSGFHVTSVLTPEEQNWAFPYGATALSLRNHQYGAIQWYFIPSIVEKRAGLLLNPVADPYTQLIIFGAFFQSDGIGSTPLSMTQSILGKALINNNDKVVFSIVFMAYFTNMPSPNPGLSSNSWIGVGTRSMNYQGPNNGFPGTDNKSLGFNQVGQVWYNNSQIQSGLPTWSSEDTIDVAVDHGNNKIWIRVNSGSWNKDASADPSTNQNGISLNGLTSFYPVLCPGTGGGKSYGVMLCRDYSLVSLPVGFQFAGVNKRAAVGFLRSQAKTADSFVDLVNSNYNQSFLSASASSAKTWLNGQGYWTNYP